MGPSSKWGSGADPLVGKVVGGVIVFGGGLALYDENKHLVGGLGASGNTSCADHNIAWRVRKALKLDHVPNGPTAQHNDAIVYDVGKDGKSESGWGHPECGHNAPQVAKRIGAGIVNVAQGGKPPATQGAAPNEAAPKEGAPPQSKEPASAEPAPPPPAPKKP
jgi:hypothetical protein